MGRGGAPAWVYKNQIAALEAQLATGSRRADSAPSAEIDELRRRIRELEAENAKLRLELDEFRNRVQK